MFDITFASLTAFIITVLGIPSSIRVAEMKNLFDEPEARKSHSTSIPRLGGLSIFAGTLFSFAFWSAGYNYQSFPYLVAALLIMFFIGLKDDIVTLTASKKFVGQLLASFVIVFFGQIRITSLYGMFGVYDIPVYASIPFSIFTIIVITNAYNLIDGIDGLAAGIGAIASFTFGLWFYNYDQIPLCILSFGLFSSLLAFLIYNFEPARIFMGDTGSLIVGFILSILAINFVELSFNALPYSFPFRSSPAMAIAILIIPLTDTLRVFILRVIRKKSPFTADRNHLHHLLMDLGLSHRETSLILFSVNFIFIILALSLRNISSLVLLILEVVLAIFFSAIPFYIKTLSHSAKDNPVDFKGL